ncbi:MAG: energy transducer TonB, partial [Bacteroidota bacterium]
MNLFSFSKNDLDEVVFEHRNKQYGAYALRKSYDEHLLKAAASSFGLLLLFGTTFYVASLFRSQVEPLVESFKNVSLNQTLIPKIEIVPDAELLPQTAVKNTDNLIYHIVRDPLVVHPLTTPPDPSRPLNPQGNEVSPSTGTQPGIVDGPGILPANPPVEEIPQIRRFVTDMPSFEGGPEAMANYIRHQLVYPPQAIEFDREGKVVVSFVVQVDGSVTDIQILKGFGFGSEEEARRVIEHMPKWIPGKQNGKIVPVNLILPIVFQLH